MSSRDSLEKPLEDFRETRSLFDEFRRRSVPPTPSEKAARERCVSAISELVTRSPCLLLSRSCRLRKKGERTRSRSCFSDKNAPRDASFFFFSSRARSVPIRFLSFFVSFVPISSSRNCGVYVEFENFAVSEKLVQKENKSPPRHPDRSEKRTNGKRGIIGLFPGRELSFAHLLRRREKWLCIWLEATPRSKLHE